MEDRSVVEGNCEGGEEGNCEGGEENCEGGEEQRMVVVVGSAETARIERVTAESLGRMFCLVSHF